MVVRRLESLGLIIGPLLFALSPLFWVDGHYGVTGGLLIAMASVPWVYGLIGEYRTLRPRLPLLSGLWMLLVLIGMFGTVAFGLQGVFESVLGATESSSLAAFESYPLSVTIVLILAGPVFPAALLSLGAMHWWTGLTPRWSAVLLVLAAAAFPVARVTRSVPVAFIADLVMLAAFCAVAWFAWNRRNEIAA
ncbi:hypothetical protein [Brevibacterium spongiae]|uniref:Uncharacterized protein n=1 Tax=Brevibacterium spongiae TaxID=2909672 RepID=A0ABY5ST68_9MICO|nr:hypothetical protein [Brevibacterium spongiae]UVI37748.1 hypothetical protein L1F31_08915 [Brevibacterium spongiae]